jgi:hypothetical protein
MTPQPILEKPEADSKPAPPASHGTLPRELQLSLSPFLEARTVLKARNIERNETWLLSIQEFIQEYKNEKEKPKSGKENESVEENDELEALIKLHSLILAMSQEFIAETLTTHPLTNTPLPTSQIVSEMERLRIQRALYRFEIFRTLFVEKDTAKSEAYREGTEMSHLYLLTMRAWEVEEIACVRDWMYRVYTRVLKDVKALVHEADMEMERDELRCFMRDKGEIEERARKLVLVRSMHFNFLFATGSLTLERSLLAAAPNRNVPPPRLSLSLRNPKS